MKRDLPFAQATVVVAALVAAIATAPLSPGARTVALAVAGTLIVVVNEVFVRLWDRRRWSARQTPGSAALPVWRDLGPSAVLATTGGFAGWLVVAGLSGAAVHGSVVVVLGGAAAVVALIAIAAIPTAQAAPRGGVEGARRPPPPREPSRRGRRRARGTTLDRPDPSARRGPSS